LTSKCKRKPRVAILTSLVDFSLGYSLTGIILDQARMLDRNGYDYDILCVKNFNKSHAKKIEHEGLSIQYILPQTVLVDYKINQPAINDGQGNDGKIVEGFETQARIHFEGRPDRGEIGYRDALAEYDTIISHDLMFLSWHLVQNAALRRCIELWPEKNWLHWVHSGPSNADDSLCYPSTLRYSAAPDSTYVYLNETQRAEYAIMIKSPSKVVKTVYNSKDIRDVFNFSDDTCDMIDRYDLLDHEILIVYPFSSPRWIDKGVRQLIKIFSFWKKQGVKAKLVIVNAHCNSKVDIPKVEALESYAKANGLLLDEDVILSCRYADEFKDPKKTKEWRYSVPYTVVQELFSAANIFIFPSVSECCSLIQAEASMLGKFMVLNRDFIPMLEFCTKDVLHYEFTRNDPDRNPVYYEAVAREVWAEFSSDRSIKNRTAAITKTYNRDWIFKNQLEPLLYLGFSDQMSVTAKPQTSKAPTRKSDQDSVIIEMKSARTEIDYNDPYDGMACPIYETCSKNNREDCYDIAGHCMMLDELVVKKK
jgi:glycosyltransferase involved in cell wall biosynthesis